MSSSYFFTNLDLDDYNRNIIDFFEKYATSKHLQVYLINKPLGENKYTYRQNKVVVLLIPKSKITFINMGESLEGFGEFYEDFTEDIGFISDKYDYKKILGRPKEWKKQSAYTIEKYNPDELMQYIHNIQVSDLRLQKNCDLLISLITGSINEIDRVRDDVPLTLLDKIKQKIILFDGDQTRFIYNKSDSKMITIQGLSGTGKTELLLQKLKELYIEDNQTKLLFTCWNRVLSSDLLNNRIPKFFNFMKVDQQIEWNKRLFCFHAWGSTNNEFSGAYRYICYFYKISFKIFSRSATFDSFCTTAIKKIQSIKNNHPDNFQYAFDYSFIDESQDFPQSFFELINFVTKSTVYIAGDIFQNIFSHDNEITSSPNLLLSKCYRTDPKTLMFAHALGMGLFEEKKLRWLDDTQWKACGYKFEKNDGNYILNREPLRRFEDLEENNFECIKLIFKEKMNNDNIISLILNQIDIIKEQNTTVRPEDIAIIFIDRDNSIFSIADNLVIKIEDKYDWEVNRAYELKKVLPNTIYLSNSNNAKGLEFPFVICVADNINNSYSFRNTLYTMLTRSLIQSILIVTRKTSEDLKEKLTSGLKRIYDEGNISVKEPSDEEKNEIRTNLEAHSKSQISLQELFFDICEKLKISRVNAHRLLDAYTIINQDNEIDNKKITEWIKFNSGKMNKS
jgi:superfamily I DNA and RNA helicase